MNRVCYDKAVPSFKKEIKTYFKIKSYDLMLAYILKIRNE
jgi:hypothetical protein